MIFNKSQIKNNFARAISSYDQNAILQKMVSSRLVDIAKNDILDARKIIDLGSGTGFIANKILDKFPNKEIFQLDISEKMLANNAFKNAKIVADIEFLPFKKSSFDLAISSLSFQWLNDLERTIPQILETLKNRQKLHFSILGSSSLKELRGVIKDCKIELSVNKFIDEKNLKSIINEYEYTLHKEDILLNYQDC
ncbi:MAG: malonyl-CoA O-methyltransferase, partial [Rickettsiales bacterium]